MEIDENKPEGVLLIRTEYIYTEILLENVTVILHKAKQNKWKQMISTSNTSANMQGFSEFCKQMSIFFSHHIKTLNLLSVF